MKMTEEEFNDFCSKITYLNLDWAYSPQQNELMITNIDRQDEPRIYLSIEVLNASN